MIKDFQRGWAWTRAILGIPAEEIHVCGEVRTEYKHFFKFIKKMHVLLETK
jgi:hypothetical protein